MKIRLKIISLALFCVYIFFFRLGLEDVTSVNEAQRTEPAYEMIKSNSWIVPTINGEPYLKKPPFIYWMIMFSYKIFGNIDSFTARFPCTLSGLVLVLLTVLLARRLFNDDVGLLAGLFLCTGYLILKKARHAEIDITFTLFITLSIYMVYESTRENRAFLIPAFLALALATLTKGPHAILIVLITIIPFLRHEKRLRELFSGPGIVGLLLLCLVVGGWIFTLGSRTGFGELYRIFHHEALRRCYSASRINSAPILSYLYIFPATFFPWAILTYLAVFRYITERRGRFRDEMRLPFFWFSGNLLLFSIIKGKESEYILPLFPAASILAAGIWRDYIQGGLGRGFNRLIRITLWTIAILLPISAIGLPIYLHHSELYSRYFFKSWPLSFGMVIAAVILINCLVKDRKRLIAPVLAVPIFFLITFGVPLYASYKNEHKSFRKFASRVNAEIRGNTPLYSLSSRLERPYVLIYLKRPLISVRNEEVIRSLFQSREPLFFIAKKDDIPIIEDQYGITPRILIEDMENDSHPVLITNRQSVQGSTGTGSNPEGGYAI